MKAFPDFTQIPFDATPAPDAQALPEQATEDPQLAWTAPDAPGTYQLGLVAETPYFRVVAPQQHPIRVRREFFLDSYGELDPTWADNAIATVTDTWPMPAGLALDVEVEGTMNPMGWVDMPACGWPEANPLYPSPGRPDAVSYTHLTLPTNREV